jgi:phenylpyruvate tautomerase PptA (4-oxalocrotonate tautomerase family)
MPYLEVNTSVTLTDEGRHDLCEEIGKLLPLIPGKKREITMINIVDGRYIELGDKEPCLNIELRIGGISPFTAKRNFVREVTAMVEEKLGVKPGRTFINIIECTSWGAFGDFKDNNVIDADLSD